jgi:hypothetical protein
LETTLLTVCYVSPDSAHLLLCLEASLLTDEVVKLSKCSLAVSQAIHRIYESGTLMVHQVAIAVVLPSKASIHASHMRKGVPSEDATMRERMVGAGLLPFWADQELRTRRLLHSQDQ